MACAPLETMFTAVLPSLRRGAASVVTLGELAAGSAPVAVAVQRVNAVVLDSRYTGASRLIESVLRQLSTRPGSRGHPHDDQGTQV